MNFLECANMLCMVSGMLRRIFIPSDASQFLPEILALAQENSLFGCFFFVECAQ